MTLPAAPGKGGLYAPTKTFGENKLMYVSGCGCNIPGEESFGKLGQEYTTEQGQKWARNAMMNVLAVLERDLGSLDRICSFDKITVFVASADDFMSSRRSQTARRSCCRMCLATRSVCPRARRSA